MSEITRLFTSLLGVILGGVAGGSLYYLLVSYYEKMVGQPTLSLVSALILIGGGVVGGGYLALTLTTKVQKARKAKRRGRDSQQKYQSKKKSKK